MKTLKASKKLETANAMLHPELREEVESFTAQERRQLAAVYKDWFRQLRASARYMEGGMHVDRELATMAKKAGVDYHLHSHFTNHTAEQRASAGRVFERWAKECAVSALLISGPAAEARN